MGTKENEELRGRHFNVLASEFVLQKCSSGTKQLSNVRGTTIAKFPVVFGSHQKLLTIRLFAIFAIGTVTRTVMASSRFANTATWSGHMRNC